MELLDFNAGLKSLQAAKEESDSIEEVDAELSDRTFKSFGEDFVRVAQILSDEKLCQSAMEDLDKLISVQLGEKSALLKEVVLTSQGATLVGLNGLGKGDPDYASYKGEDKYSETKKDYKTAQAKEDYATFFQKTHGVLQTVLGKAELGIGFYPNPPQLQGEVSAGFGKGKMPLMQKSKAVVEDDRTAQAITLTGFAKSPDFGSLLKQCTHWKDPGAPLLHGEFTHRLQWWIVNRAASESSYKLEHKVPQVFAAFPDLKAHNKNAGGLRSAWDWACDQIGEISKDNPKIQETFRNPERFHFMLLGNSELAAKAPHLRGILRSRVNKRTFFNKSGVTMADYMTGKYAG